jgi:hypothetical protein
METRLKARANRAKSGPVNSSRRLSRRRAKKKSERKGRRSFDPAIEYGMVAMLATEKTRIAQCGTLRASCWSPQRGPSLCARERAGDFLESESLRQKI